MFYNRAFQYSCLIALLIMALTIIWMGYLVLGLLVFIGSYVVNELLWTDHIRYDRKKDYNLQASEGQRVPIKLTDGQIICPADAQLNNTTILLEVTGKSNFTGYLFDPYIEISTNDKSSRQYLERGFQGKRYINISHHIQKGCPLSLTTRFCSLTSEHSELIIFKNPDLTGKRTLVLAPHADDAEIAAFGLYSHQDCMIVTVTAGESEPNKDLQELTGDKKSAQLLKGRLRTWDSIAIPLWAGLKPENCVQLGYSDNSLKQMYNQQDESIEAQNKPVFRESNSFSFETDSSEKASWKTLKQDFSEIITRWQPEVIITPHPTIDAHSDHQLTTIAIKEVIASLSIPKICFLYYTNHLSDTDHWPFGLQNSLVAPPPGCHSIQRIYSRELSTSSQIDKACALEMMHDLRPVISIKKQLRSWLHERFLGRLKSPAGYDPYFRKAVRTNELFIVERKN